MRVAASAAQGRRDASSEVAGWPDMRRGWPHHARRTARYHRCHACPDLGHARHAPSARGSAWSRWPNATSTTWPRSPLTLPSGAGSPACRWTDASLQGLARPGPGQRGRGAGSAVRHDRPRHGPGDRQQPVHVDRAGTPAGRDRLDVAGADVAAKWREPRGQAAPADPRVRDARCPARRVQDPRQEPRLAGRPAGDRGDVRRRPPPPRPDGRRLGPRLGVLRDHRCGVASRSEHGSRPRSRDDGRSRARAHHDDRLPHRGRAIPDRDRWHAAARGRDRPGAADAGRPRTWTTSAACSSTSHAATPTCTGAS